MTATEPVLDGRDAVLAALLSVASGSGPRQAALIAGAGMGKTTVVRALIDKVEALPVTLLRATAAEGDSGLDFTSLEELLARVPRDRYDDLPEPQRSALLAALLIEAGSEENDPRAVSAAVRGVLQRLSNEQPVVLVVDDAHWMDAATANTLAHALRRSREFPIRVVAAARPTGRDPHGWLPGPGPETTTEVGLPPMSPPELRAVIYQVLGISLGTASLLAVAEASEGNPLFALELARHRLPDQGGAEAGLDALLAARLAALPRATRLILLCTALAAEPTLAVVAEATNSSFDGLTADLEPARADGLIIATDRVRFNHPLYANAVIATADDHDLRATHTRLATCDLGPEARVRHRGLASRRVDPDLADDLDTAANAAHGRGAWDTATDLMRLAIEHTSEPEVSAARAVTLGRWHSRGGRPDEAQRWLRQACDGAAGPVRWRAWIELLDLFCMTVNPAAADEALRAVGGLRPPPAVRAAAQILRLNGRPDVTGTERLSLLHEIAAQLEGVAEDPQAARLLHFVALNQATSSFDLGRPSRPALERARALAHGAPTDLVAESVEYASVVLGVARDDHVEGRALLSDLLDRAEEIGDDESRPPLLHLLGWLEFRAGRWDRSVAAYEECVAESARQRQEMEQGGRCGLAELRGLRGDVNGALADLDALGRSLGDLHPANVKVFGQWRTAKSQVLLAAGRVEDALDGFLTVINESERREVVEPGWLEADVPFMECAIGLGRLAEARQRLGIVEERARRIGRPVVLAGCQRIRVLLRAAEGDLDGAVTAIPAMLEAHDACPRPLLRGHAFLTAGRVYRRAKAKTLAHQALLEAVRIYDELGTPPYADQARAELARVGLRPHAPDQLTDTERQVADLAVQGLRNREIADRIFVSPKTVEATLSRTYRKLGIRSRAELARALDAAT